MIAIEDAYRAIVPLPKPAVAESDSSPPPRDDAAPDRPRRGRPPLVRR
jgi:hypothetical protein